MDILHKIIVTEYTLNQYGIIIKYSINGHQKVYVAAAEDVDDILDSYTSSKEIGLSQHDAILIAAEHEFSLKYRDPFREFVNNLNPVTRHQRCLSR